MKVLNIEKPHFRIELNDFETEYFGKHESFINQLLEKGIFNDYVFDHYWIAITVELDEYIQFLYRYMWEDLYLHIKQSWYFTPTNLSQSATRRSVFTDNKTLFVDMSLSEALQFIELATPPALKHLIPESTNSVDNVIAILKQFLMEENGGQLITYIDIFKKTMRFNYFETRWSYDLKPIEILREVGENQNGLVCAFIASTKAIEDIAKNESPYSLDEFQLLFHCQNDKQVKLLIDLTGVDHIDKCGCSQTSILNIKPDNCGGFYVMCYYQNQYQFSEEFRKLIKENYRKFIQ